MKNNCSLGGDYMTAYEKLLIKAENLGIRVREVDFETDEECGYYHNNKILINSRLNEKQKYGVLAEELGHHCKTFGDITDQSKLENRKQELIARRWGYAHTVNLVGLIEAFEYGLKYYYEVAEFLGVTETYLYDCIEDYKKQYGEYTEIEQYCIIFVPNLRIVKKIPFNNIYNPVNKKINE